MDMTETIAALGALAQTTRLETFRLLVAHEPRGLPAGEVARRLGVPQNTMSTHLAILARAGLVRRRRLGRSVTCRAGLERLRDLTLFLVDDCCGGDPALCDPLISQIAGATPPDRKASTDGCAC